MRNDFHLNLPEIGSTTVCMENPDLAAFAKRQFLHYLSENGPLIEDPTGAGVVIKVENGSLAQRVSKALCGKKKLSNNILVKEGKLKVFRDFGYAAILQEIVPEDTALTMYLRLQRKQKLSLVKERLIHSYARIHQKFYDQVLYPLFGLYALWGGYCLNHGALLGYNNRNIMIAGLDGVGKSSLAVCLMAMGYKLLGDNFIMLNDGKSIGLNLPVRLPSNDPSPLQVVFENGKIKECLAENNGHAIAEVDHIVLVSISENLAFREIWPASSGHHLTLISNGASEIAAANQHCSVFHYLHSLIEKLDSICEYHDSGNTPRYWFLEIPKGKIAQGAGVLHCRLHI